MAALVQAIRGMNDILPSDNAYWHQVESAIRAVVLQYGYSEIRCPVVESTDLFIRAVGTTTDIVEKEMYTFADRNGDSLSLRPEGTAGCVRAAIEHGLLYNQTQRLWYMGPMFRHERPQRGRYRQFYQFGVEAFGWKGPDADAEVIAISARLLQNLGLREYVTLELNTLGSFDSRIRYRKVLTDYFRSVESQLDEESRRRLESNPLRILDSKNPALKTVIAQAPLLMDHLDEESLAHFTGLREYLDAMGIDYVLNPRIVRGLDYYCHSVFEWTTDKLGAQSAVAAGGRYDALVEQLGGPQIPAAGFGLGIDRVVNLLEAIHATSIGDFSDIYVMAMSKTLHIKAMSIVEELRNKFSSQRIIVHCGEGSIKSQMKKADKSGAKIALIFGENEFLQGAVTVKWLRESREQEIVLLNQLDQFLKEHVL